MKTPDKIYIVDATFPDYVDFDGSPINTKRINDHDIEYIRKDALVKYLYEEKGYPITLNGELVHWDELNKNLVEYIKLKKDALIEKARKWFNSKNGIVITDTKAFFEDFINYIEE